MGRTDVLDLRYNTDMEKPNYIKEGAESAARGLEVMEDDDVAQAIFKFVESIISLASVLQLKGMSDEEISGMLGGSFSRTLYDWAKTTSP